ncbi:hypothetical protein VTK26DRAFT_9424 [Humicola hyalothermophila]
MTPLRTSVAHSTASRSSCTPAWSTSTSVCWVSTKTTRSNPSASASLPGCLRNGMPPSARTASSTRTPSRRCASSYASTAWAARLTSAAWARATTASPNSTSPPVTTSLQLRYPCASP